MMRDSTTEIVRAIARIALPALWQYFEVTPEHDGCIAINAYYEIQDMLEKLSVKPFWGELDLVDVPREKLEYTDRWDSVDAFANFARAIAVVEEATGKRTGLTIADVNYFADVLNELGFKVVARDPEQERIKKELENARWQMGQKIIKDKVDDLEKIILELANAKQGFDASKEKAADDLAKIFKTLRSLYIPPKEEKEDA